MSNVILTAEDKERLIKIVRGAKEEGKSEEVIKKIVSAFNKKFGKQQTTPPQQTTPTGGELAKQRYEAWKKALPAEELTKNPIEKYIPYTNGIFDVTYKDKSKETIFPSGRSLKQNKEGRFYMGTYDGNLKYLGDDDAKTTYDKYGDKAWLSDEEEKELGIKRNPNTGKYEKIDQTNTQIPNKSTYTICPEILPVKKLCKNEIVRDVQRCLRDKHQMGIKVDGYFGPKTEKALIKLGLKGDVITAKEYNIACTPTDLGQSSKPNTTGYDDYSNDEYEDSSEKPEQEFSTGYEDYTLEEN